MLQNMPGNTNVYMIIQAITPDGYFQYTGQVSDKGYLTLQYCHDIIIKFTRLHPEWEFIYTGCL